MDTSEIVDLYMRRPSDFAHMGMGAWFANAILADDKQPKPVLDAVGEAWRKEGKEFKQWMLENRLNQIRNLKNILSNYNRLLSQGN